MNGAIASGLTIRPERSGDEAAIYDLTKRAFATMPFAGGDEQDLVNALRDAGALTYSLVAEKEDRIVGHIAFSPAHAEDDSPGWYALGPVSVEPDLQKAGIGSALIHDGLARLQARGAAGCILVGNPEYYSRFGFEPAPESCPDGEPAEYYQMLPFASSNPGQIIGFHPLFHAEAH